MKSYPYKRSPSDCKRVMEKLVRGRGLAEKLVETLARRNQNENNPPQLLDVGLGLTQQELVDMMLRSFNDVLSMFSPEELEEASQDNAARPMKRCKKNTSDDSEGSIQSSLATPSDRRGCYKRKGSKGDTWTKFTPTISTDDYQWRKYGQKSINNAAHPRSYFRCTHQADKGCPALKQVQKISEDPVTFCTTYEGRHTCIYDRKLKSLEIAFDNEGDVQGNENPPFLISFNGDHMIDNPAKNKEIRATSSGNNYSDHRDVVSKGHHGSFMDMVADTDDDDLSHFITNCLGDAE